MTAYFLDRIGSLASGASLFLFFCAAAIGFALGKLGKSRLKNELKEQEKRITHAQKRIESLQQSRNGIESASTSLKNQNLEISGMISLLPDAVEKLSTSENLEDLLKNQISITERLLRARDVSVFLRERDVLVLKAASGNKTIPSPPLTITIGEGKIGWVAEKGISMTDQDLEMESNLVKNNLAEARAQIKTRICSPLIHNGKLLGVLNIGELAENHENNLRVVRMITSLGSIALGNIILKDQVRRGSETDALTGVYSLQYFLSELRKELGKARRYKRPLSLCHFKIDHFRKYNELNGYLAGDEVLRIISKLLKDHLREQDLVARYEGGEFVLICPETKREDAASLAEKLRMVVLDFPVPHKEGMPKGLFSVSVGVSGYPDDGTDEAELIRAALEGTKLSIASGRNRVTQGRGPQESGKFKIQH